MSGASLVVVGTGSLAHATCDALATVSPEPINVAVVGRSRGNADAVCYLAGTRATGVRRELLALRAELRKQPRNPAQTKGL